MLKNFGSVICVFFFVMNLPYCRENCSTDDTIIGLINNSFELKNYIKSATDEEPIITGNEGYLNVYPKYMLLGFTHLNEQYGSGINYDLDDRFSSSAVESAYEIAKCENLSICSCGTNWKSQYYLILTPKVDDLTYAIVYNVNKVRPYFLDGYFNLVEGEYLEFLFQEEPDGSVIMLHAGQVSFS